MPAAPPPFAAHCLELLAPLGAVRARRMFGGHGLYVDALFIALIADDRLYLKADADSRPLFERAGCAPFAYSRSDRLLALARNAAASASRAHGAMPCGESRASSGALQ